MSEKKISSRGNTATAKRTARLRQGEPKCGVFGIPKEFDLRDTPCKRLSKCLFAGFAGALKKSAKQPRFSQSAYRLPTDSEMKKARYRLNSRLSLSGLVPET